MPELTGPWLEIAVFLPLMSALWVGRIGSARTQWAIASAVTLAVFVLTLVDWSDFAILKTFEAHDPHSLTQTVFGREFIVVDELNAPLLALASLLFLVVISLTPTSKLDRFPFGLTLMSLSLTLALLSCRSPIAIILFLAAQNALPLIELKQRKQIWQFFALHQFLSLLLILVGWSCIDLSHLNSSLSNIGIVFLVGGLLIRCGSIPTHCWLVDLFDRASMGTALLFVTPMAGAYGLLRMVLPIAPEWLLQVISVISLATALYCAGMGMVQTCTRRFYCYLLLSNSSLMLVGLEALTPIGLTGSLSLWLSIGISLMSLGIVIRAIEGRVGRVSLDRFHGLYRQMPWLAIFFLLALLAGIGFPGTVGFVGVELLVESALHSSSAYAVIVVIAMSLNGIAALRVYFRLFTGTPAPATISLQPKRLEKLVILAFSVLIIVGGLYPQPGVQTRFHAANVLLARRGMLMDFDPFPSQTDSE